MADFFSTLGVNHQLDFLVNKVNSKRPLLIETIDIDDYASTFPSSMEKEVEYLCFLGSEVYHQLEDFYAPSDKDVYILDSSSSFAVGYYPRGSKIGAYETGVTFRCVLV